MKGLLLKDLYMAWRYCRTYLLLTAVFLGVYLLGEVNTFYLIYPCALVGSIPMSLISYDEREHWDRFAAALPFSRNQIVGAKYVVGLVLGACTVIPMSLGSLGRMYLDGGIRWMDFASTLSLLVSASLMVPALLLPFVFKYGAEKGRMAYYIVIGIACGLAALVAVGEGVAIALDASWMIWLPPLAAGGIYLLSYLLSIRFYEKREL